MEEANIANYTEQIYLDQICYSLKEETLKMLDVSPPNCSASVTKRNRKLSDGDFVINLPGLENLLINSGHLNEQFDDAGSPLIKHLKVKLTPEKLIDSTIVNIDTKSDKIFIKLNKEDVASYVIKCVLRRGKDFGKAVSDSIKEVVLNLQPNFIKTEPNHALIVSLHDLRTCVIGKHVGRLLEENDYGVKVVNCFENVLMSLLNGEECIHNINDEDVSLMELTCEDLKKNIEKSKFRVTAADSQGVDVDTGKTMILDLKRYIAETGDIGYSYKANFKEADFSLGSERFKELCKVENCRRKIGKQKRVIGLHVVPFEHLFQSELMGLGWDILSGENSCENQYHVAVGPVSLQKSSASRNMQTAKEYVNLRHSQVKEAFSMKYGKTAQTATMVEFINLLTVAAIRFELLITNNLSPLKLDLSHDKLDTRGGVFIMYNYARLSTLFDKYETAVENGTYSSLPSVDGINFSHLQEAEEWEIIFNYLLMFPTVVCESVKNMKVKEAKVPIQTNKIAKFLQDLSNAFSSYYNRVHVLCEPYPHLFPQMYTRLWLMKAVQVTFVNCFSLLEITPIERL